MQQINTPKAPQPIGPYSQAVLADHFLFISGQIALDPEYKTILASTVHDQTKRVLDSIEAILIAAQLSWRHVVKVDIYLKDLNDFEEMNQVYIHRFPHTVKPARQVIQAARLPLDALIEISCIACTHIHTTP